MRFRLLFLVAFVGLVGSPAAALAHAMRVVVEVTADEVRVEVKYDGADHGGEGPTVTLFRLPGKEVVDKKPADKSGVAVFAKPAPGPYLVYAEDEFHDATREIVVSDVEAKYEDQPANRWLMIAVGVAVIATLTAGGWYFSRRKRGKIG